MDSNTTNQDDAPKSANNKQSEAPEQAPATDGDAPVARGTDVGNGKDKKTGLLIGIIVGVIVLIGGGILLYMLLNPPKKVVVDKNAYIYACNLTSRDMLVKTFEMTDDKSKEAIGETRAFVPDGAKEDLNALSTLADGRNYIRSTCDYMLSKAGSDGKPAYRAVQINAQQYANPDEAKKGFEDKKPKPEDAEEGQEPEKVEELPSYPGTSIMIKETGQSTDYAVAYVVYKHVLIDLAFPIPKTEQVDAYKDKLDTIVKDLVKNADGATTARQYNNINQLDGKPFIDACQTVKPQDVAMRVDSKVELMPEISLDQNYGWDNKARAAQQPENDEEPPKDSMMSSCLLSFTYTEDKEAQDKAQRDIEEQAADDAAAAEEAGQEPNPDQQQPVLQTQDKYPHFLAYNVIVFRNNEDAKAMYDRGREQQNKQQEELAQEPQEGQSSETKDFSVGDAGFRTHNEITTPAEEEQEFLGQTFPGRLESKSVTDIYLVLKGNKIITFAIGQNNRGEPYKMTIKPFSEDQAKKLAEFILGQVR